MLFITNRVIKKDRTQQLSKKFDFELSNNSSTQEIYFCIRNNAGEYEEIGSQYFFNELKHNKYQQILLYIHGYNNLPEDDIFPRTALLQKYFDEQHNSLIQIIPIIWPCDNDLGVIKDYWDDKAAADLSGFAFKRAFSLFTQWSLKQQKNSCYKFINILTHSMGTRVLRESLHAWKKYNLQSGLPLLFRNSFLIASDISYSSLESGQRGEYICDVSRNVVIFHANDDLVLGASKIMNAKNSALSKRLGHSGPRDLLKTAKNVYSVDCDSINNEYDAPLGHAYFLPLQSQENLVLKHIIQMMVTGRFSDQRTADHRSLRL